jgi:glycosyltransferase involved in cell wall biosynthesis
MKIGIDARLYGAGKNRGIGRYIAELLSRLDTADPNNEYVVFLRNDNFDLYNPPANNISKIKIEIPWYSWQEQLIFPWLLYKHNFDLIHFMHFNVPLLYWRAYVLTIHDLIMTHYSDDRSTTKAKWLYYFKIKVAKLLVYISAHRAKLVLCPSSYTETDLIRLLGITSKKIKVTPEAVMPIPLTNLKKDNFRKYQPYFLYVGAAYPHKNLEFMIKGFYDFNINGNYHLLCVGRKDFFYHNLQEKNKFRKDLIFLGEVTDEELFELYTQAIAFVYPSLLEGFGLPPLEAMAAGTPVIASSASCLPEVLGEAAYYINPHDQADMTKAFVDLSSNHELREHLQSQGRKQVALYSWDKTAALTWQTYK